jgi:hypothetical protein
MIDIYLFIPVAFAFWIIFFLLLIFTSEKRTPLFLASIWIIVFLLFLLSPFLKYVFIAIQVVLAAYAYYRLQDGLTV